MSHRFTQVDVFSATPLRGNALAVVHDASDLADAEMQAFAAWTQLAETTFLLPPIDAAADYRVRIFTPEREMPFAGHPTLGSCHAWLAAGGMPRGADVVQQCGVGCVRVRRAGGRLAFAAPPRRRSGTVAPEVHAQIARSLRLAEGAIVAAQWVDNGPGWVAALLASRDALLAVRPDYAAMQGLMLGAVAPCVANARLSGGAAPPAAGDVQFEVRAFVPTEGAGREDPVTGSLNASLAQWLIGAGLAPPSYVASQGTALGRAGRVHVDAADGEVWIGGDCVTCIDGTLGF